MAANAAAASGLAPGAALRSDTGDATGGGCSGSTPDTPTASPSAPRSLMAASSLRILGATVPARRFASHTSFAAVLPRAKKSVRTGGVHASRSSAKERTLLTCAPRWRCAPAQRWQITTSKFRLAQSGLGASQSAHLSFPGAAPSSARTSNAEGAEVSRRTRESDVGPGGAGEAGPGPPATSDDSPRAAFVVSRASSP